ncbi:MAG TPA: type II secretion system F family protein [Pirellulaceae bacterium]|nr:type II secretion system F family protein [Pirellulaceae bacterium]
MTYVLLGLAFVAGFLVIFGVNLLFADISQSHRQRIRERLDEESRLQQLERARTSLQYRDLYELAAEESAYLQTRKPLVERVGLALEQAGLKTRPSQLVIAAVLLAGIFGGGVGLLTQSILIGVLVGPAFACLPFFWVNFVRSQRMKKLQSQLPDAFDLMSRTMRAGQTISQALQAVADEAGAPLSEEFGYCYDQQNLGMSPEAAMRDLARRTGLLEVKIFVLAVMVHRQTGGNLAELLEKLSAVIRDRYRIQGMIQSLTAEGKLQAGILLSLPILLLIAIFFINRPYMMQLFQFPLILVGMFAFMGLGALWMSRIINFDF